MAENGFLVLWPMKQSDSLDALRAEIEQKRELVARLEQECTDLELEIAGFEVLYNSEVKPIQDELDAVKRHIEGYRVRNDLVRFRRDRLSPMQLEAEVERRLGVHRTPPSADPTIHRPPRWEGVTPPRESDVANKAELKSLYRELAKRFHPDLAPGGAERAARGAHMADINDAYARGDLDALRRTASQSGVRPNLPPTLQELLAERDRLETLVIKLRQDIAELNRDPLMLLKIDAALARHSGRDVLAELAIDLHVQLVEQRGVLSRLIAEFRELVEETGLV
jgi:hypothetical protein